jgi:hypothetical protein
MFDQSEEVRAGRHHGPPDIVLGESVQLPDQNFTGDLEIAL